MSERHKLQCCVGYLSSYKLKQSVNLLCRTFCNHNHLCRWHLQRTDYHNTRTEQDPNGGRSHATECRRYQAWFLALLVIRAKCWQHRSDTKYPRITLARQNVAKLAKTTNTVTWSTSAKPERRNSFLKCSRKSSSSGVLTIALISCRHAVCIAHS